LTGFTGFHFEVNPPMLFCTEYIDLISGEYVYWFVSVFALLNF
jgi:hypothetical protein